jgi:hypothetical protein
MRTQTTKTVPLGDLVVTVFDKAAQYSADPQEVSRLATHTISRMLWNMPTSLVSEALDPGVG